MKTLNTSKVRKMKNIWWLLMVMTLIVTMGTLSSTFAGMAYVKVSNQSVMNGTVTIAEVSSPDRGWLVVHAQADGKPGPILGYSPVSKGLNRNVLVKIDGSRITGTLYAMLHLDAGTTGEFEFPGGPDGPVKVDGKVVTPPFQVLN